jgi:hypothetical protein
VPYWINLEVGGSRTVHFLDQAFREATVIKLQLNVTSGRSFAVKSIAGKLVLIIIGLLIVVVLARYSYLNTMPQSPVFPESVLLDTSTYIHSDFWEPAMPNMVTSHYRATVPPENITEFYRQQADCATYRSTVDKVNGLICQGQAKPFGRYSIFVNFDTYSLKGFTDYTIEIEWGL